MMRTFTKTSLEDDLRPHFSCTVVFGHSPKLIKESNEWKVKMVKPNTS